MNEFYNIHGPRKRKPTRYNEKERSKMLVGCGISARTMHKALLEQLKYVDMLFKEKLAGYYNILGLPRTCIYRYNRKEHIRILKEYGFRVKKLLHLLEEGIKYVKYLKN